MGVNFTTVVFVFESAVLLEVSPTGVSDVLSVSIDPSSRSSSSSAIVVVVLEFWDCVGFLARSSASAFSLSSFCCRAIIFVALESSSWSWSSYESTNPPDTKIDSSVGFLM